MLSQLSWMALLPMAFTPGGAAADAPHTPDSTPAAIRAEPTAPQAEPTAPEAEPTAPEAEHKEVDGDTIPQHRDPEVIRTDNFTMTLGSRVQVRYTFSDFDDTPTNGSFGIRRARFSMGGAAYDDFRYAIQLELAGASVNLIDANIRYQAAPMATLWLGQGKAFFGRQQLTSSGNQNFVDRTVVDGRFSAGRQAGVALLGQNEGRTFEYNLGLYNGNGINSPNDDNRYLTVARMVWTPLGAYAPVESAHDYPSSPRVAVGASAYHNTIGTGIDETEVTRFNVEGAFKRQGLNVTAELYREQATPNGGDKLDTAGWYTQAGYLLPNRTNEIAIRYAVVSPDVPTNADVVETGAALSHYLRQHRAKIQADVRSIERKLTDTSDLEMRLQLQITL